MRYGFRLFLLGALGVAACAFTARGDDGTEVKFDTLDGVTLKGTFFTADPVAPAKDKKATVLLLHNIDKDKGGSSHQDGWDDLAKSLSAQGYSVLSFDFRGFGKSHEVSDTFWDPVKGKHNVENVAHRTPPPDSIDHKDFDAKAGEYYPYLVNDIIAAKSYLDRQTEKGTANSSSLFVIGAGEGATLGAVWMATQWHLKRFAGLDPKTQQPELGDPEGKDIAGAVWLSISPKLGARTITTALSNMTTEVGADDKVPMAFLYGSKDETSDSLAKRALQDIERRVKHDNPGMTADGIKGKMELTNTKAVEDSKLVGSQLLGVSDTPGWIIKYVNQVSEKRGLTEPRNHDVKEYAYYWTLPGLPPRVVLAKSKDDENINLPPMDKFIHFGGN